MLIRNRLIVPTAKETLDAFNTETAHYSNGTSNFFLNQQSSSINTIFIIGLFSFLYQERYLKDESSVFRIESLRQFFELSRGGKSLDIRHELKAISEIQASIRGSPVPLAEINIIGRYAHIQSEYFTKVAKTMRENARRFDGSYGSSYCSLVYADIIRCKNFAAAEVAIELCKLTERRGIITEGHPVHISISQVIARCPTLRNKTECAGQSSRRGQIIRDDIARALILLQDYTEIYEKYTNLVSNCVSS